MNSILSDIEIFELAFPCLGQNFCEEIESDDKAFHILKLWESGYKI